MDEAGYMVETQAEARYEWVIHHFPNLPKEVDSYITSPYFSLSNTRWFLALYPNGLRQYQSEGWIGVYLHRDDAEGPRTIRYVLGVKRADGSEEAHFSDTICALRKGDGWGAPNFLARNTMNRRSTFLLPKNKLTVTCSLRSDQRCRLQGDGFTSRAIQTEMLVANSRREEPSTSSDMKGVTLMSERMKELLINGNDHDVRIVVKNKEFRAHRNILRARSPVFAMMLTHDTKENNPCTISIEDCDPEAFDEFLLYVYSGKTENLTPRKALSLYYAADKYDFPVLKEQCVSFLKTSMSKPVTCDVIFLATKHEEKELLETATVFFAQNIEEILETVEWKSFLSENPTMANELYMKSLFHRG